MPAVLLHGTLLVTIFGIDRIHIGFEFNSCFGKIAGSRLYATVDLDRARVARTRVVEENPKQPVWDEKFYVYCAHLTSNLIFTVKNDQLVGTTLLGTAYLPAEAIINGHGREVEQQVPILDEDRNPIGSNIRVKVQYIRATDESNWSMGIGSSEYKGVPRTFFNQRQGCKVTLYQDAHVPADFEPGIYLSGEKLYEPQRCWEDMFDAIINAKHLIYITGWSVYTQIALIRDPRRRKPGDDITLGELLKRKADEGVAVLMLIWDDITSIEELKRDGLMATHDKETNDYFRNTNVHCFLCPRNPDDGKSIVQGFQVATMFTHHQKTVVVDSEVQGSHKRRVVSFVGGIDLCDGRYDTLEHPLFGSLGTTHYNDFYQPNFLGASIKKGGPREPWHDIHCRLEGPVAWDVLYNFEQRWKRQVGGEFLITHNMLDKILVQPTYSISSSGDTETWNVQLFRSIDGGAAYGFPETPEKAAKMGLISGKDNIIDRSIQDAYIDAIRRAKNFIYIESQYFLGSSFGWSSSNIRAEDVNALHLIPKEISLKIVSKIEARERFCVYIVIPMWPEGIPESVSVQAILDWQRRTMEMMYSDITQALLRKGIEADPREYLTFFCLGNREERRANIAEYEPPEKPDPDTDYSRAQQSRRFMIYVHSKMMIVDDEYIIIGSANINQRSMDGARDSEIAMGAFQPYHIANNNEAARGQIYGFRMALWREHLGVPLESTFRHPETKECVPRVNQIAQMNWKHYCSDAFFGDLPGHLLRYPIEVSNTTGAITALPGFEFFPDTMAKVLGTKSDYLPPILTT